MSWGKSVIEQGFVALEHELTLLSSGGSYCVGSQLTIADCFLVPQVYNARRFNVDMSQFPLITSIDAHLSSLDAFKRAHPSVQPDAQE
jgi:glutathione S-transferase